MTTGMTLPNSKPPPRRVMEGTGVGARHGNGIVRNHSMNPELKARLLLFVACLWPLWILALFGASAPGQDRHDAAKFDSANGKELVRSSPAAAVANTRFNLRSVLDRVDVMGYGPTHPRLAVVVVGEDRDQLISSVESVFSHADINRIFVICAVLDGSSEDPELVESLQSIDSGSELCFNRTQLAHLHRRGMLLVLTIVTPSTFRIAIDPGVPHWHGLKPDKHLPGDKKTEEDEDPHSRKVHVMFNPSKKGVAASRLDAVEFVRLLESKHESAGFKSPDEDLILLLLQAGSQLKDRKWLGEITSALIVPPPLLGLKDESVAMKLANAVSFHVEGTGKRTSFNEKFAPLITEPTASDMNLSNGRSYPTPALNGAAIALRLGTFVNLPAQDPSLMEPWSANLDLSLNLWLCADGIDIIEDVEVKPAEEDLTPPLDPEMAARFAAVWMDRICQQRFFQAYSSQITRLDWETKVTKVLQSDTIPRDLANRCRSFEWYAKEVNTDLSKILEQGGWESRPQELGRIPGEKNNNASNVKMAGKLPEPAAVEGVKQPEKHVVDAHNAPPKVAEAAAVEGVKQPEKRVVEADKTPPKAAEAAVVKEVEQPEKRVLEAHKAPSKGKEAESSEAIPDLARNDKKKPSIPLRPENLKIVAEAKPVDISFSDVSGGHSEHPHLGATDDKGALGYIHDETALRKNPPEFKWEDENLKKACISRDTNYRMMTERVVVDLDYNKKMEESGFKRDKIFCLVYTIDKNHHTIPNIRETWG